jgi:hypothetical protein
MKILLALALMVSLGAAVQAKPAPPDPSPRDLVPEDTAISVGDAGAMLESDYFRAPQEPFAANLVFPCRLQLRPFEKRRLAQSCH